MTTVIAGQTIDLLSQFYTSPGGSLVDLDATPTVQISEVATGTVVLGPTTTGVTHDGTGSYGYAWTPALTQHRGDYLVLWAGTKSAAPVTASETITVLGQTGEAASGGPCSDWPVDWSVCDLTSISPAVTGAALTAATEVLYALSGRRFGVCQLTIRPCRQDCFGDVWGWGTMGAGAWWQWGMWPRPLFYQGVWYNITCGQCISGCSCQYISEARLPSPVQTVTQVKVDGVVLSPTAYRVDDWRKLVRTDGNVWPICQDLSKDDTQVGTWSVTVQFGEDVPKLGQLALGELACQFAKLLSDDETCTLPKPVQSLTRQGVQMNFLDPNQIFADGRIGLYLCDLFLTTENPYHLPMRSRVYDVDGSGDGYRVTNT